MRGAALGVGTSVAAYAVGKLGGGVVVEHLYLLAIPIDEMRVTVALVEVAIGERFTRLAAVAVDAEAIQGISREYGVA